MDDRASSPHMDSDSYGPSGPPPAFLPPRPMSSPSGSERQRPPGISGRRSSGLQSTVLPPLLPPRRASRTSLRQGDEVRWSGSAQTGTLDNEHEQLQHRQQHAAPPSRSSSMQRSDRSGILTPSVQAPASNTSSRASSIREQSAISARASLETLHEHNRSSTSDAIVADAALRRSPSAPSNIRRLQGQRRSALRYKARLSDENVSPPTIANNLLGLASSGTVRYGATEDGRPYSHPPSRSTTNLPSTDPWALPPMDLSELNTPLFAPSQAPSRAPSSSSSTRPRASLKRLSSYQHFKDFQEERQAYERQSLVAPQPQHETSDAMHDAHGGEDNTLMSPAVELPTMQIGVKNPSQHSSDAGDQENDTAQQQQQQQSQQQQQQPPQHQSRFHHIAFEACFCITIAASQFLCEYLISGFAIVLPHLLAQQPRTIGAGATGSFWPAALLTLLLSAMLLIFARISDMKGGYGPFMFGLFWLAIWTFIPGFYPFGHVLEVSRAMQGLALAALNPATFTMIGSFYATNKPRRNLVLGIYGAFAPTGFYAGFLIGGALPVEDSKWFFIIAGCTAVVTALLAWCCVPRDRVDRRELNLSMDWAGAFFIVSGLILVTYALSVQPSANQFDKARNGFTFPIVYAPLTSGLGCLLIALWVEKHAECPLLPYDFFEPKGVFALCIACLFFFASFGVWLYNSAEFFASEIVTGVPGGKQGIHLSVWYTPLAIGGIALCILNGWLSDRFHIQTILILSGLAWVGAPLIFALAPFPINYWYEVLPSMLCATLGIDLTYTATTIALSSSQPTKYQGIAGAVTSILVNLAMSFSLPISLIVEHVATVTMPVETDEQAQAATLWGYKMAFLYGAASAGVGLLIVVVCMGKPWWGRKRRVEGDLEMGQRRASEASALVHDVEG